jgi:putative transposase
MKTTKKRLGRYSIRLKGYDYSRPGRYFVTICTKNRECLFGDIINDKMQLNSMGSVVDDEWKKTSMIRNNVELGEYVVMPNHIHGIIIINDPGRGTLGSNELNQIVVDAIHELPLPRSEIIKRRRMLLPKII